MTDEQEKRETFSTDKIEIEDISLNLNMKNILQDPRSIVLFDGVCNLCNTSVQFIIDRDPKGRFAFASLQSEVGQMLSVHYGIDANALDSLVLIDSSRAYQYSTAALRIARRLSFPWFFFSIFLFFPKFFRDPCYRWVAKHRYHFFGKEETCRIPHPSLKKRFLQ